MRARGALLFLVHLAALAGCTFPDVTFEPSDATSPTDANVGSDATREAGNDATNDGTSDAPPVDAYSPADASDVADVVENTGDGEAGVDCDQDHDTYASALTCGGNDCDDTDPRANPGVTTYQTYTPTTTNPLPGDWNCNHILETEYPENFSCAGASNCSSASGFSDAPGCGATGTFITCMQTLLSGCQTSTTSNSVAQGCK